MQQLTSFHAAISCNTNADVEKEKGSINAPKRWTKLQQDHQVKTNWVVALSKYGNITGLSGVIGDSKCEVLVSFCSTFNLNDRT